MSGTAGVNTGWWTPENESWFQNRLRAIRDGTGQPHTATEWIQCLKGHKLALRFKQNSERTAEEILKKVFIIA
jgi:hypothetical protein